MESMIRMMLVALLTVSAASAVQFSVERSLGRVLAMAGECEDRVEENAGCVARAVAHRMEHRLARGAQAGLELAAAEGARKLRGLGCGVIAGNERAGNERLGMAYGH